MIQPYKMASLFGENGGKGSRKAQLSVPRAWGGGLIIGQRHDGRLVHRGESSFVKVMTASKSQRHLISPLVSSSTCLLFPALLPGPLP